MTEVSESMLLDPSGRVRALSDVGCCVTVDSSIPPHRYFRSGMEMNRMANMYLEEGNLENAFIMYTKFITLFVEKLPKHVLYKEASAVEKANNKKKLIEIFPKAEKMKKILITRYEEQAKLYAEKARQNELELEKLCLKKKEEEKRKREQYKNAAISIANKLNIEKPAVPQNLPMPDTSGTMWPESLLNDQTVEMSKTKTMISPDVPRQKKPTVDTNGSQPDFIIPNIDRSSKPSSLLSPGVIGSSNKSGLRDVIVPSGLISSFSRLAQPNTDKNIETCGILAGRLIQGKFNVTHLLIPKQRGTPDSCTTENEEDLFEYQDKYDLITLGWIHTHPSQTSFLSSVDLHTHFSYQIMMHEAIAIVIAPKYNE
ncbi:STAM-binding protein-like A [Nymphon striatum]|nr:STAM-binding protein-like A [Nymphon striatum]